MKKIIKRILLPLGFLVSAALLVLIILIIIAFKYNGIWKMEAYGLSFDIKAGYVKTYEVTDHYYTRMSRYDGVIINGTLYSGIGKFKLKKKAKELALIDKGSQTVYRSNKQRKNYFKELSHLNAKDSAAKFKMYYETFKENYAFAKLYDVDFDEEYKRISSLVQDDTTDAELYGYMCDMVKKLDDGHVDVTWNDQEYTPSDYQPEWTKDTDNQNAFGRVLKTNYVKDYYKFKDSYIRYGTLNEDTGYIIILGIGMEELNKSASTKKAMDKIIKQFQNKDTVVIDLRLCGGGYDEASLMIAGYFTSERYLTYQKQAYYKGEYTKLQDIYVKPNKLNYDGKVVILTSNYTISAAETLIRDMLANPENKVTIIGEETAGYYSDSIPKKLPGGLGFAMSTERYYWYDGTMLEGNGIRPDKEIPFSVEDVRKGKDSALDWIMANY